MGAEENQFVGTPSSAAKRKRKLGGDSDDDDDDDDDSDDQAEDEEDEEEEDIKKVKRVETYDEVKKHSSIFRSIIQTNQEPLTYVYCTCFVLSG